MKSQLFTLLLVFSLLVASPAYGFGPGGGGGPDGTDADAGETDSPDFDNPNDSETPSGGFDDPQDGVLDSDTPPPINLDPSEGDQPDDVPDFDPPQDCADGTSSGQCSLLNPGFICNDGSFTQDITCGCPAGQFLQGNACVVNNPPVITVNTTFIIDEGENLNFFVNVTDVDGQIVTLSAQNLPSGATLNNQIFDFTPDFFQAGTHVVTFTANDGIATTSVQVTIIVNNVDQAPILDFIADQIVNIGETLLFLVTGRDPDGEPVTFGARNVPTNAEFRGNEFIFTPDFSQEGEFNVIFSATAGNDTTEQTVRITVENSNLERLVLRTVNFPNGDRVAAGDNLVVLANLKNDGNKRLKDVKVRAFIMDEGIVVASDVFDIDPDHHVSRLLYFTIPSDLAPGIYYVGFTAGNGDHHKVRYREVEVI